MLWAGVTALCHARSSSSCPDSIPTKTRSTPADRNRSITGGVSDSIRAATSKLTSSRARRTPSQNSRTSASPSPLGPMKFGSTMVKSSTPYRSRRPRTSSRNSSTGRARQSSCPEPWNAATLQNVQRWLHPWLKETSADPDWGPKPGRAQASRAASGRDRQSTRGLAPVRTHRPSLAKAMPRMPSRAGVPDLTWRANSTAACSPSPITMTSHASGYFEAISSATEATG